MPLEKDPELADLVGAKGNKTAEFEHKGKTIKIEYRKPTVSDINEARDKAMVIQQKGRSVSYRLKIFDFEVHLLKSCLRDSTIPGIPQGGEVAIRNIADNDLWNKLLVACEAKESEGPSHDDLLEAAEAVVEELGTEHPAVAKLHEILEKNQEEDDVKK